MPGGEEERHVLELQNAQLRDAHAELEQSRHRYSDLYDKAPVGFLSLDGKGCIREINETAAGMLGWSPAHLTGKPLLPHIARSDRKTFLKHLWESRRSTGQVVATLRLLERDGIERHVQFATCRSKDSGNHSSWCRTAILDISEQHRAETALSASEAKFRLLAENMGEVFWFMELDPPRVTYVSPAFERIWGIPAAEVYAEPTVWENSIHPEDRQAATTAFNDWIRGEISVYLVEYRVLNPSGEIRWLADRGVILDYRDGHPLQLCGIARDITARKHAEEALAESAREMSAIVNGSLEGIVIADVETRRLVFGNAAFCSMVGVPAEELPEMTVDAVHPESEWPELHRQFQEIARGRRTRIKHAPLLHREGRVRLVDITASPLILKGRPSIVGILHDITELKQAEERFKSLMEAAPDALVIVNARGIIEMVNAQAVRLFDYAREDLVGQPLERLVPERFRDRHVELRVGYGAAPRARQMSPEKALSGRRRDGSEFPAEISLSPLETAQGKLIISSVRDISARMRAEQELRHAQFFAQSTLDAVPARLAVLDGSGTIVSANQAWQDFARDHAASICAAKPGTNYLTVCDAAANAGLDDGARFGNGIREVMGGSSPRFTMEYACHMPDELRWFVAYVTPFLGNGPHSVVIALVDINERKRAEEAIQRLNAELESEVEKRTAELRASNEELRRQIVIRRQLEEEILEISERERQRIGQDLHDDLGQQLAGIWCLSQVLENDLASRKSPEAKNAAKITHLLKDALALTRTLARGLHPVALKAGGLTAALEELAHRSAELFQVQCHCKGPPEAALELSTATHLFRIAQEAITNAVKHGHAGEIEIELSSNPRHTVLSVRDDGTGLPARALRRSGMGVRIMHYRANLIGGALNVQRNSSGTGTIVTCMIPTPPRSEPSTKGTNGHKSDQQTGKTTAKKSLHRR
jgi:PAS domain S-box-containing protein